MHHKNLVKQQTYKNSEERFFKNHLKPLCALYISLILTKV